LKVAFTLKSFFADKKLSARQINHFLLAKARVDVTLFLSSGQTKKFALTSRDASGTFWLNIEKDDIPNTGAPGSPKRSIVFVELEFTVAVEVGTKKFSVLTIKQQFDAAPTSANSDTNIDYDLSPKYWRNSATWDIRSSYGNTHPLLDLSNLKARQVLINALVVDLTELWAHLHQGNFYYAIYKELTDPKKVSFKVFAHLGGGAFIWYVVVPSYLASSSKIAPHVFYPPSDWSEIQNIEEEADYLFKNTSYFQGSALTDDGRVLLLSYLLPPTDDDQISKLTPKDMTKKTMVDYVTALRRNVVGIEYRDPKKTMIDPQHWRLGAGFERALYGLGKVKPQQILLVPQRYTFKTGNDLQVKRGNERERHLKNVTHAILDVLQSNTPLIGKGKDGVVSKDQLVLSAYSESGADLWESSKNNLDDIKAIIGIEPNSVNPKGKAIIPKLLDKKIQVVIIGRHKLPNNWYQPELDKKFLDQILFLPKDPVKVLHYPPDPDSNAFVKYRVARFLNETLDPLMLQSERDILKDLAKRKPPLTGKAAIDEIFSEVHDSDDLRRSRNATIFYTHHFALTGGQEMTLADPHAFYDKPVTYRTFFQEAVDAIK
jgi:hypothetical protein